jgi:hypothetical protein
MMKTLLTLTAVIEAGAGLALLGFPSETASLLLGTSLDRPSALSLVRVGGAAVLGLAIACWLARRDANNHTSRGLVVAMLFYNIAVGGVLAFARLADGMHGMLLWPAIALHAAMSTWCITNLLKEGQGRLQSFRIHT